MKSRGAKTLYGGGSYPLSPFYYGLYGGSELSGVLDSDPELVAVFSEAGYRAVHRSLVLHRDLVGFRPVVDRQQMQQAVKFLVPDLFELLVHSTQLAIRPIFQVIRPGPASSRVRNPPHDIRNALGDEPLQRARRSRYRVTFQRRNRCESMKP